MEKRVLERQGGACLFFAQREPVIALVTEVPLKCFLILALTLG